MKKFKFLIIILLSFNFFGQNLQVSNEILKEIENKKLEFEGQERSFKIRLPENYDPKKSYPVFLGLSGGNQTEAIVDYCYAAWFRNDVFRNHLLVMPVGAGHESMAKQNDAEWDLMMNMLRKHYKTKKKGWILSGTSNGGIAAFHLLKRFPRTFSKVYVTPGYLDQPTEALPPKWKRISFYLRYGDQDDPQWKKSMKETADLLRKRSKHVILEEIKGQGHILNLEYDQNELYR
ncbi:MAG: hypothetical protein EP338_14190 [Bacteroidetes bacterium]|nr:MAG: hypothetical protein EP338_14190 [Bacteroidota bacterium]